MCKFLDYKIKVKKIIEFVFWVVSFVLIILLFKYNIDEVDYGSKLTILAIYITIIIFRINRYFSIKDYKNNQLKIITSLLAELDIVQSSRSDTYFGEVKGNIDWYEEQLKNNTPKNLDHHINKISFFEYVVLLDSVICDSLDFSNLTRSLSYLNDKIEQINLNPKKSPNDIQYILSIINEVKTGIKIMKKELIAQKKELQND